MKQGKATMIPKYWSPSRRTDKSTDEDTALTISFTISDIDSSSFAPSALSSNTALVPVSNIVFFTWRGEWTGLLQGRGYKGQPLRAFFNFRRNRIVFPVPADLDALGTALVADRG